MTIDFVKVLDEFKGQDFGFSTTSDEAIEEEKNLTKAEYESRMKKIEELIMPLLVNLYETGDQAIINWPNRKPELESRIKQFLALTRGE